MTGGDETCAGDSAEWLSVATAIAIDAGEVLRRYRIELRGVPPELKGRRDLVTVADRAAERVVVEGLRRHFPEHAILAEEGVLTPSGRADRESDYLWLVDPLDGTTNFVHGLPFFGVAMSLSYRGELVLGVVHAPALEQTFTARKGGGAHCNDEPIAVTATAELRDALLATGLSYVRNEPGREDNGERICRAIPVCRDLRRLGSAQLDLCLTAMGTFDGYWEMYLAPYDLGAGGLIVREAGGRVTDLAGGDDWLEHGHVLASNGVLHEQLSQLIGGAPSMPADERPMRS